MDEICYIHVADLHLDAPFSGLNRQEAASPLSRLMRESSFKAVDNLVELAKKENPDFILIAGDIYDQEDHSIKAQLALQDFFQQLDKLNIPVFMVHGNHDPISSRFQSIPWPANVKVFGSEAGSHTFTKAGEICAVIHGISLPEDNISQNPAKLLKRTEDKCFQVGLLHCSVEDSGAEDKYSACKLDDLIDAGMDAWALGHVHKHAILNSRPFIAYSGNVQGSQIKETGQRGCYVVRAKSRDGIWHCEETFKNLAPILWENLTIDISEIKNIQELEEKLKYEIETFRSSLNYNVDAIILRIRLEGKTEIDANIRKEGILDTIFNNLSALNNWYPAIYVNEIEIFTEKVLPQEYYLSRADLLGELMRLSRSIYEDKAKFDNFISRHLSPLLKDRRYERTFSNIDEDQLKKAFLQAEYICQSELEKK